MTRPITVGLIAALPLEFFNLVFMTGHLKGLTVDASRLERFLYGVGLFLSAPPSLLMRCHLLPDHYSGVGVFICELLLSILSGYLILASVIAMGVYVVLRVQQAGR